MLLSAKQVDSLVEVVMVFLLLLLREWWQVEFLYCGELFLLFFDWVDLFEHLDECLFIIKAILILNRKELTPQLLLLFLLPIIICHLFILLPTILIFRKCPIMTSLDPMTEHISLESLLKILLICMSIILSNLLYIFSHKHYKVIPFFINQRFQL